MKNRNEDGSCKTCGMMMCDCAMVIKTEPPEKIYLALRSDGSLDWEWSRDEGDIEYHLAPVWHDASEPKKEGKYLLRYMNDLMPDNWFVGYWEMNMWFTKHGSEKRRLQAEPDYYLAIPLPPEERRMRKHNIYKKVWWRIFLCKIGVHQFEIGWWTSRNGIDCWLRICKGCGVERSGE
jgi:hypothetical protein